MPMSDELIAEYANAIQAYTEGQGPIPGHALTLKSWRYFLEINSGCNLRCVMCACGSRKGYEHVNGTMNEALMEQVLDKIQFENPNAIVHPYGNSEPFLHPDLAKCIRAIKRRNLRCEFASNLNHVTHLEETLDAKPDFMIVSVSGFTQEVYEKSHVGGSIERVKTNMELLKQALDKSSHKPHIAVNYHMYRDNLGEECDKMKAFTDGLGFQFMISWARAISMENTIQYLRHVEKEKTGSVPPIEIGKDGTDWNELLPPVTQAFMDNIKRLSISPEKAREMYARFPVPSVCPVGDAFTFIRHDGIASLCACVSDRRMNLGNYLEVSQDKLSEMRRGNPICKECLKYRLNLYFHVVDPEKFNL